MRTYALGFTPGGAGIDCRIARCALDALVKDGRIHPASIEEFVKRAQDELRRALPNWSDPDLDAYVGRHYAAYWLKVDLARKVNTELDRRAAGPDRRGLLQARRTGRRAGRRAGSRPG